jgi:hypothetical protein
LNLPIDTQKAPHTKKLHALHGTRTPLFFEHVFTLDAFKCVLKIAKCNNVLLKNEALISTIMACFKAYLNIFGVKKNVAARNFTQELSRFNDFLMSRFDASKNSDNNGLLQGLS